MTPTPTPHVHDHGAHLHTHEAPDAELLNLGAGEGTVMLDIGDGVGALVLYADADAAGLEIEITPAGRDEQRSHVAVLARPGVPGSAGQPIFAAVYPTLEAGRWNLWTPGGGVAMSVDVTDGAVTEARWVTG
jgi:hypothetical protein